MPEQLPLNVLLPDDETFESFVVGNNAQIIASLKSVLDTYPQSSFLTFISGENGCGKSHLMYALCHRALLQDKTHIYIDLKQKEDVSEELLQGLENIQLVCLDNVQCLDTDLEWQVALFDFINRVREVGICKLVVSADKGPNALNFSLPDLQSRLAWGISFQLFPLEDEQRILALLQRAERRGLNMSIDVARFLLTHMQRDMPSLINALNELDTMSLREKRKLTIPFVKSALNL